MSFIEEIKSKIGEDSYLKLDRKANGLFSILKPNSSLTFNSINDDLIVELIKEFELFEEKGLKITPIDVINIIYKCKLLKSCKSNEDYRKKVAGLNYVDEFDFFIPWEKRNISLDDLIQEYFERLKSKIVEHTLIIEINSFNGNTYQIQSFLDNLFKSLNYPFKSYIDPSYVINEHKRLESLTESDFESAKTYFNSPSIGFSATGSLLYCRSYSNFFLKSFLSLLKVGGFIYPGQVEFGGNVATAIQAPNFPVFLGTSSIGLFVWDEDKKEPLTKIPDGCLSRSFGNRSMSKMWLDIRTFHKISNFISDNSPIFELLKKPWNNKVRKDVLPTLDILNSTVHSIDIGAKILLTYCCLEHLFVPMGGRVNNKEHIVNNINLLDSSLNDWFVELYDYRCDYAHKGYIRYNDDTLNFIRISIYNVLVLLRKKLSQT
ncbi:hypothetical protein E9993_17000 [Labilibacter sediminis]|nr:hypothetical protein E9993_17000 [Labilibacter sediminis]